MKNILGFCLSLLLLLSCNGDKKNNAESDLMNDNLSLQQKIANASGFPNWNEVTELRFTFNVDRPDNHFERAWIWNPKTQDVTVTTKDNGTISYNRKTMTEAHIASDQGFINDKYWLLAPFQLIWDKGTTISVTDSVIAPITKVAMQKLTIVYNEENGYTPGDAYDLYFTDDYLVKEWVFRKGNVDEPSMLTTWERYEDFNGLKLATSHYSPDRSLQLYFTDVEVLTD